MKNRIRILATTDMHGYIYPYRYSDNTEAEYGCARLKTLIDLYRDENTILIDNGDVLQGSPLQFYHFAREAEETAPITKVMNAMGYDYVNLGNHDFNYGENALLKHLDSLNMPCLTSNVILRGKPLNPTYAIREIAGVRIALFGVVTHCIPRWEKPDNIKNFRFKDAFDTARKTVELIRRLERPDYVIGIYHGSFERDPKTGISYNKENGENQAYQMIREIDGLDVLITGHTHAELFGRSFNTTYAQAGKHAEALACVDIYTDTGIIEPHVLKADTAPNEEILRLVQETEDRCQKWLDTPLGKSRMNLKIEDEFTARLHKSQLATFLNMVQKEVSGADLSAVSLFQNAVGFGSEITMRELVSTYVYPNSLMVLKIDGAILREYLEKTAEFWAIDDNRIIVNPRFIKPKKKMYFYDMVDGIEYDINVRNDIGHRVTSILYQGKEVTDDMEFTLVVSNYRAAGGSEYTMLKKGELIRDCMNDMVEEIALWIIQHRVIEFEPVNNIHVHR